VNLDGVIDVFDIVAAIDCIFSGGLCPGCREMETGPLMKRAPLEAVPGLATSALPDDQWAIDLTLTSPAAWRAAQFEFEFSGPISQVNVQIEEGAAGLKPYWHQNGHHLIVGLVDIRGAAVIPAGNRSVLEVTGRGSLASANLEYGLLADENNERISVAPAIAAGITAETPSSYSLGANYPNPFNAGTVINYSLGGDCQARLDVFDILGRHVRTLADEIQPAGPHQANWDGTDSRGRAVASGMYFYRLTAGGYAESKKMVLLK
jgi:hypothetical protein